MSDEIWLNTLKNQTLQEGFELAITLSRKGVKYTHPAPETLIQGTKQYAENPDSLTAASQVMAAANDHWKHKISISLFSAS